MMAIGEGMMAIEKRKIRLISSMEFTSYSRRCNLKSFLSENFIPASLEEGK